MSIAQQIRDLENEQIAIANQLSRLKAEQQQRVQPALEEIWRIARENELGIEEISAFLVAAKKANPSSVKTSDPVASSTAAKPQAATSAASSAKAAAPEAPKAASNPSQEKAVAFTPVTVSN